ncbi:hypothetical protein KW782_04310 [Candidatus Parcubacteria bacterium]|nr:hypothetical protein [Candidatus Parcubacteria bacterium]
MILFYKYKGETPLQALERLKKDYPQYKNSILSYAGRLDPMAEGLLLILEGSENKEREKYLGLDKEYKLEILFGIETDTYDVLGKVVNVSDAESLSNVSKEKIQQALKNFVKTFDQEYPPYSSQPVSGKPLFQWAREGKIAEIKIPKQQVTIYSAELLNLKKTSGRELLNQIQKDIALVKGDFRQVEILDSWQKALANVENKEFLKSELVVTCSSGTYMRSLAQNIGKILGMGGLAYSLTRTKISHFLATDSLSYPHS